MILIFEGDEESIINQIISTLHDKKKVIQISTEEVSILTFPGLTIQPYQHRVLQDGKEVALSHLEFATLLFLAQHPGWVFSKTQIYEAVWKEAGEGCGAAVTNVISQIRRKIGSKYITTVIGSGYKFKEG